ncbi:MAG: hypothetical protein AAFQ82_17930, partial [Myxococcota bacterium]
MNSGLLSVDVVSAIRKLTESQLSRPEMRSVELVRALFFAGARSVEIVRESKRLIVKAAEAQVSDHIVVPLTQTLDVSLDSNTRYAALLELEARGGLVWLALATHGGFSLRVSSAERLTTVDVGADTIVLEH